MLIEIQESILMLINLNVNTNRAISLSTNVCEIGIDSLIFVKIIVSLENEFKFEFDDDKLLLSNFQTIQSLAEYIEKKIK